MVSKKKSDISHKESPETQMLGLGYNPWWSEGAVKPPLFLTSTFMFRTAEDGEEFFSVALSFPAVQSGSAGNSRIVRNVDGFD